MFDVLVVGGGVIGATILRELTKYNLKVCLLEKENDVCMGQSKANSGIVHAGFDAKEGSLKARLNVRGSEMMEQVTKELGVKYVKNGSLVVGFENEREEVESLVTRGIANGVKGVRLVEKDELHALDFLPDSAQMSFF